jgi:ribosomal protein S21
MLVKKMSKYKKAPKEFGVIVRSRRGENPEKLIARFKRLYKKSGMQKEVRERYLERFISKSEKKRKKKNQAKRRWEKQS